MTMADAYEWMTSPSGRAVTLVLMTAVMRWAWEAETGRPF